MFIRGKLRFSCVLDSEIFTVEQYRRNSQAIIDKIKDKFVGTVIVRSSAREEDRDGRTLAGHFKSVLNVNSDSASEIDAAVNTVICSYADSSECDRIDAQQIFVQRQVLNADVAICGVGLSFDPRSRSPFYYINYEDSGDTVAVTSGGYSKSVYIDRSLQIQSPWSNLINAFKEIEEVLACKCLDVEFAVLKNGDIIIFQVRKLPRNEDFMRGDAYVELLNDVLKSASLQDEIYSDMAFWNPAEMIGCSPRPLDYSLYKKFITDRSWNLYLSRLGYATVDSPIMTKLGNHPYVSVSKTAQALTPQNIPDALRMRLVEHYLKRLSCERHAHDKVEFELIFNCDYLGLRSDLSDDLSCGFTDTEIDDLYSALNKITVGAIVDYAGYKARDLHSVDILRERQDELRRAVEACDSPYELVRLLDKHISELCEYVAPQFAYHARCAFIARKLSISAASCGKVSEQAVYTLLSSVPTVITEFVNDMSDEGSTDEYLTEKYGHLRNSTYSILSNKYEDIKIANLRAIRKTKNRDCAYACDKEKIYGIIAQYLKLDKRLVNEFVEGATQMRELLKFVYGRSVSLVLDAVEKLGEALRLDKNVLSYIPIDEILTVRQGRTTYDEIAQSLSMCAAEQKAYFDRYSELLYPSVVASVEDFHIVKANDDRPNFVTTYVVEAEAIDFDRALDEHGADIDLNGKIVITEKAEPGNDWIFSKFNIAGLIAKYGGAASHMAIRCLEQGIPAALGCGEGLYKYALSCKRLTLDCKNGQISEAI